MRTILRALRGGFSKRLSIRELPVDKSDPVSRANELVDRSELSSLSFTPEVSAQEYFRMQSPQLIRGTFEPVGDTTTPPDECEWQTGQPLTEEEGNLPAATVGTALEADRDCSVQFTITGTLPLIAVRSNVANTLKSKIGGDAANLGFQDTIAVIEVACKLGMPVVLAGRGLLASIDELACNEYAVSTLGSRNSEGNFIHALVVSPVLSLEEILSCRLGPTWLANIIRKEQLLVSYRPIRGVTHCEDLADRARSMPIDAASIISKQRGIEVASAEAD